MIRPQRIHAAPTSKKERSLEQNEKKMPSSATHCARLHIEINYLLD
jgi:hypothetical protein